MKGAQQYVEEHAVGVINPAAWANMAAPKAGAEWDFTTTEGQAHIRRYQEALLWGIRAGAKKPMNMTKVSSVTQQPGESPRDYHKRLCEAYRIYTPFDPKAQESQQMVNTSFMAQATPDIRKKLQKLEGFAGMNITQLIEIANKVYMNREVAAKWEADKKMKTKVSLLATTLKEKDNTKIGRPQPPPLGVLPCRGWTFEPFPSWGIRYSNVLSLYSGHIDPLPRGSWASPLSVVGVSLSLCCPFLSGWWRES